MLTELHIENLAVIETATIPFSPCLNAFTGETGAGKSVLIHGINAVMGQRVTKDLVRTGCKKAVVSARFTHLSESVLTYLQQVNLPVAEDSLVLTREIFANGGSTARVGQQKVSVAVMRELGVRLIHIHGQHDTQILRDVEQHLQIVDQFGENMPLLQSYQSHFHALQRTAQKLKQTKNAAKERQQKQAYWKALVKEVSSLEIQMGEEDQIAEQMTQLQSTEDAADALRSAWQILEESETSVLSGVAEANRFLSHAPLSTQETEEQDDWITRLQSVQVELSDLSESLFHKVQELEEAGQRYQQLQQRAEVLRQISKTYLCTCDDLLRQAQDAEQQLQLIAQDAETIATLQQEKDDLLKIVSDEAKQLSQRRKEAAERFADAVTEQLAFLDMPNVVLQVKQKTGNLTIRGIDNMEFLISANKGETPKPLAKIASGGELSRIMLALICVISNRDQIPTLIFDEIDTGVSGRAARKIGLKLKEIAKQQQVLCVTHLMQIAVEADHHLLMEKQVIQDRTATQITLLDFDARVHEIARIMGNSDVPSELTLQNARDALQKASQA
jgi:DNA repair protein RecN (Recombination protein N)